MSMKDWSSNSHNMEMKTQQNEPLREAYDVNDEWVQDFWGALLYYMGAWVK